MSNLNASSPVHWHQIIASIVCHRQVFLGRTQPSPKITANMLNRATKLLQGHLSARTGSLAFVDPENPAILVWQDEHFEHLVIVHWDRMLALEETLATLLIQYALHRWDFDSGYLIDLNTNQIFEDQCNPQYEDVLSTTVLEVQRLYQSVTIPEKLENIDRCMQCPQVDACNPFEQPAPLRTLLAPQNSTLPLLVALPFGKVRKVDGEVWIDNKAGKTIQKVRLQDISSIVVYGSPTVTTPLLHECSQRSIPVHYHDDDGWYKGSFQPITGSNIAARYRQYQAGMNLAECIPIVQAIISAKIHNCRTLLKRNATPPQTEAYTQLQHLKRKAQRSLSLESIRGIEGAAARLYFQHFSKMLKVKGVDFSFESRNRRPPRDPINTLLSFGYGCLYREVTMAIQQVGLDPWMGFLHVPESGRAALALDMMEEFRAVVVDSIVINMVNNNQVQRDDFERVGNGLKMNTRIKGVFLKQFHHRLNTEIMHPQLQVKLSYQRIIQTQVQLLIKALTEVNGTYKGFVTR